MTKVLPSVCPSFNLGQKPANWMKRKKVPRDVGLDEVVAGVGWCVREGKGETQKYDFRRMYTVYGILSLFQGHSPGGATV